MFHFRDKEVFFLLENMCVLESQVDMSGTSHFWSRSRSRREKNFCPGTTLPISNLKNEILDFAESGCVLSDLSLSETSG